jgi:hypothetical protein
MEEAAETAGITAVAVEIAVGAPRRSSEPVLG